ncbi:MAG: gliding motility-associated C-terminal domain-containing protein [Saprospiraceae bacterium]
MNKILLSLILVCSFQSLLLANDLIITPIMPTGLEVCQTSNFALILENPTTDTAKNITIEIQFPNGLNYMIGSVTGAGATEQNVSTSNQPLFSVPNFLPGQKDTLWVTAKASCGLIGAINAATTFQNTILANFTGGTKTITTSPFSIETALLVINPVVPVTTTGYIWGDVLTRTITVRNTRPASLAAFTFKDSHGGELEITSTLGTSVGNTNQFEILLSGADFATVGNGDTLFDFNEIITITENITIRSCGGVVPSILTAEWGCDGSVCQSDNFNAAIQVLVSPYSSNVEFTPSPITYDDCYCGDNAVSQSMVIKNTGDDIATFLQFRLMGIEDMNTWINAIDDSTITMTQNGVTAPIYPVYWEDTDLSCMSKDYKQRLLLSLPDLLPGDSVIIDWNLYYCMDTCSTIMAGYNYGYGYFDNCPAGTYTSDSLGFIKRFLSDATPEPINFPDTFNFEDIQYKFIDTLNLVTQKTGYFRTTFQLPCGITWDNDPNDFIMDGQLPFTVNYDTVTRTIFTEHTLPFTTSEPIMDFSILFDCDESCIVKDGTYSLDISSKIHFDATCDTSNCNGMWFCGDNITINMTCNPDDCQDTLVGVSVSLLEIERINFGISDANNDGVPEPNTPLDTTLVIKNRAMIGDTIRTRVGGKIIDEFDTGYQYAWWQSDFRTSMATTPLLQPEGMPVVSNYVEIHDSSTNTVYTCPNLEYYTVSSGDSLIYYINLNASHLDSMACAPASFRWEQGDSIFVESTYKIVHNVADELGTFNFNPVAVSVTPNLRLSNDPYLPNYYLWICDTTASIDVSGYRFFVSLGSSAIRPCVVNDFSGLSSVQFYLAENNFFPFEYREFATLQDITIEVDSNFTIDTTRMTYAGLPNGPILLLERGIDMDSIVDNTYHLDLSPFRDTVFDEGFYFFIQNIFDGACSLSGFYPMTLKVESQLSYELNDSIVDITKVNGSSLRPLKPSLGFFTILPNITASSDTVCMDFTINNMPNNVGSLQSDEAFNFYMNPVSPSGAFSNFQIIDQLTGLPLTGVNDIFTYGDLLKNESRDFTLCLVNTGCGIDDLQLNYGWNCSVYTNPSDTTCYEETAVFNIEGVTPELEMTITTPSSTTFSLCNPIPYHISKVFNAELGVAKDIKLEVIVPQGMSIISGTAQISYPDGSSFVNIPDPIQISGNTFEWDISQLQTVIGANGLKNINNYPDNMFNVRFNVIADCDYIAGSYLVFRARGNNQCDEPTNVVTRSSNSINIVGANPAYTTSINIISDTLAGCTDAVISRFDVIAGGATGTDDSVFVTLPAGIDYVANSYIPITNATNNSPLITTNNGIITLKWGLNNVSAGSTISFSIQGENYSNFACGESLLMQAQTVSPANALCVSSGVVCNILVSTGFQQHQTKIDRGALQITNLQFVVTPSGVQDYVRRNMTIKNNGAAITASSPIVITYYYDTDGDGIATAADNLLFTQTKPLNIPAGGTANLSVNDLGFNTPAGWYCNIIAVIDSVGNCLCSGDQAMSNNSTQYNQPLVSACSGDDISIGVTGQSGYQYSWQSNQVSCGNCPMTTINITNNTNSISYYSFVQTSNSPTGCATNYNYSVGINPIVTAADDSLSLCIGDSTQLASSGASSYLWAGQNVTSPNQNITMVTPTNSQWYHLNALDNSGCAFSDSTFVRVDTLPSAAAGLDVSICDNAAFTQLNAIANPNYSYSWSPFGSLSNPFVANPTVFPSQTTTYTLVVTDNNGCQTSDEATVYVVPSPAPTTENQTICFGESLTYNDSTINTSGTYRFTIQSWQGCDSALTLNLTVLDSSYLALEEIICAGETYELGDSSYNQTGNYCYTFSKLNGCDSVVCVDLVVANNLLTNSQTTLCFGEVLDWNGTIYTQAGEYFQSFTASTGCDSVHRLTLDFHDELQASLSTDSLFIGVGNSETVEVFGGNFYNWSPPDYLSCTNCSNPLISPESDINYEVIVTDLNGCDTTMRLKVKALNQCIEGKIGIPNAITPNNDGQNDAFGLINPTGLNNFKMRIYNRWGELVFETTNPFEKWEAKINTKVQHGDAFVYVIEGDCIAGEEFFLKGSFLIIK